VANFFDPWEKIARCINLWARLSGRLLNAGTFIVLFIRVIGRICHKVIDEVFIELVTHIALVNLLELFWDNTRISNYVCFY